MIDLINLLRAKSEGKVLLKDHTIETIKRAKELKNFVDLNKNNIEFQPLKDNTFFESLYKAAFLHDLGKISYEFQKKMYKWSDEGNENLFDFLKLSKNIEIRHEILSSLWASFLLGNSNWDKMIKSAILLHHYNEFFSSDIVEDYGDGVFDLMSVIDSNEANEGEIKNYVEFLSEKSEDLRIFIKDLLDNVKKNVGTEIDFPFLNKFEERVGEFKRMLEKRDERLLEFSDFYNFRSGRDLIFEIFLGALRRCDYSASGDINLEILKNIGNIYSDITEKIKRKVKKENIWQEDVINNIGKADSIILVAPTGSGKTEFAILWSALNRRKLIYTLPLRVALNDLFSRFKESYFNGYTDILHSTSFIEYIRGEKDDKDLTIGQKLTSAKLLSSPVLLTTPDQVFLTSLKYYGSDKIVAVYPLSSIVIDEIQTYNEGMAAIIINTINMIRKVKGDVLIMTATLPPYFEPFLKEFKKIDTHEFKENIKNYELKRHRIKVIYSSIFEKNEKNKDYKVKTERIKEIKEFIKNNRNIMVVVNNVRKAVSLYKAFEDEFNKNIFLLHSRLLEKEKGRRIKDIKEKLRKGEKVIVVSTQIIEASVDFDFDFMITEISTIDSQIQRWGRVYRNRNKDYSGDFNIVIYSEMDRGTKVIYDSKVIEKTLTVLKRYENELLDYEGEKKMIEEVFEEKVNYKTLKEIYIERIQEILEDIVFMGEWISKKSEAQKLFRRIAGSQFVLPDLMEKDLDDNLHKSLAEILKSFEFNNKTWNEIIDRIKEDVGRNVNKWEIKKVLYEYSITIPYYMLNYIPYPKGEFKGFKFLLLNDKKEAEKIRKYGIEFKRSEEDVLI